MQNNLLKISKLIFAFSFFVFFYTDKALAIEQATPTEPSISTQELQEKFVSTELEPIVETENSTLKPPTPAISSEFSDFTVPTSEQEAIEPKEINSESEEAAINVEVLNDETLENNVSLYLEDLPANNNINPDSEDALSNIGLILLASLKKTLKKPKLCSRIYEKIWKGDKKYRIFMLALITKSALKIAEKGFKKDISGKANTMLNYFLAMMCATALAESESSPSLQDFLA